VGSSAFPMIPRRYLNRFDSRSLYRGVNYDVKLLQKPFNGMHAEYHRNQTGTREMGKIV